MFTSNSFPYPVCFFFIRRNSSKEKLLEKVEKEFKHKEVATEKAENDETELGAKKIKKKWKKVEYTKNYHQN